MSDEGRIKKPQVARLLDCAIRQVDRYQQDPDLPLPIAVRAPSGSHKGHLYDPLAVKLWEVEYARLKSGASSDNDAFDYNVQRTRLTRAQAEKAEFDLALIRGDVIRYQVVVDHWQDKIINIRAKLLAMPSRLAPIFAAPDRIAKVQEVIRDFVYEALTELAGEAVDWETVEKRNAALLADEHNKDAKHEIA